MSRQPKSNAPPPSRKRQEVYFFRNERVVVPAGYLAVGRIVGVHGLRGELKVELHTDFPERFTQGAVVFVGPNLAEKIIEQARPHRGGLLVKLFGVDDRSEAERFRNVWLFVEEADAMELDEDQYWIHDLIGLSVVAEDGRFLGTLTEVLATGANDVYVLTAAPDVNNGRDILVPAIADVVLAVDLSAHRMIVRLPEGLLDV